jgi:hypothetical protein
MTVSDVGSNPPQQPTTDDASLPGELQAEFLALEKQITIKLYIFVDLAVNAKLAFDDLIPELDKMQAMLSQRGSKRNLLNVAGVPGWEEWYTEFEKRCALNYSFRTVQRRLKEYRADPDATNETSVNEIATKLLRALPSRTEQLKTIAEDCQGLNPTIRQDLIRALKSTAKKLVAAAKELEKGSVSCPLHLARHIRN